jgi:hypothetical protein
MAWVGPAIGAAGSILGGIAGGKGSRSRGPSVPQWYSQGAQGLAQFGRGQALQPYQAPPGDRVAPFSPDTLAAFDMVRGNVGSTQPAYQNAMGTAERLQGYNAPTVNPQMLSGGQFGQQVRGYMNPYTDSVVNASLGDLEQQRAIQSNVLSSQAQAAGAFGGSRFGVAQGQFEADALRNKGLLASQLRNQGFESAASRTMQSMLANQQAGLTGQLANQNASLQSAEVQNRNAFLQGILGDRLGAANAQDAAQLGSVGSAQQAQQQQGLNNQYSDWQSRMQYPSQQVALWQQALSPGAAMIGGQAGQSGGLLGALGGAQLGSQVGSSVYNWWQGLQQPNDASGLSPVEIYANRIPGY